MPKAFEECIRKGGKVRTKRLKGGRYQHICILNGKTYAGEVKKRKKNEGKRALKAFKEVFSK